MDSPVFHGRVVVLLAAVLTVSGGATAADPPAVMTHVDADFDVVARRTDAGGGGTFEPGLHHLVELRELTLGRWDSVDPQADLFTGGFASGGGFVRIDIRLDGLHHPPGNTDPLAFSPFAYGDHPVYGFVEIDVDDDNDTGGELDAPQFRYLGNVVRFGGVPEGDAFAYRVAHGADAFDGDFLSMPYVERHGEEFHLALLGDQFDANGVDVAAGDADLVFEAGEVWDITGTWFHRAHGFERYSIATGGTVPGEYAPACVLRFAHDPVADVTTISLVFPINNAAAAAMTGANPQSNNHDPSDQASINEALQDLTVSASIIDMFPTGEPEEQLILGWKDRGPGGFLQPGAWRATVLLGVAYSNPGYGFVWTDIWPNVLRGNVNGENGVNQDDSDEIDDSIEDHDLDDGLEDDRVTIDGFPTDFSRFDINHDGVIDALDVMLTASPGDGDGDGDVDLADFAGVQRCLGWTTESEEQTCGLADLDADGTVGLIDLNWWLNVATGPVGP